MLIELAAWRERAAQAQDVPRNRILRDEALYDIASHAPTETAQLSELRTLSEGFAEVGPRQGDRRGGQARVWRAIPRRVPPVRAGLPLPAEKVALRRSAARAAEEPARRATRWRRA